MMSRGKVLRLRTISLLLAIGVLQACVSQFSGADGPELGNEKQLRILAIGTSLMRWNALSGNSIAQVILKNVNAPVVDRSQVGSGMLFRQNAGQGAAVSIPEQYISKDWDWTIITGGGNDLLLGCGCMACHDTINELVSENARSGKIPDFLRTIRDNGSKILYIGYLRSPGLLTPIEHCKNEGDLFEARLAKFADREENIYFASMQNIVPYGDASYFSLDRIHPSRKTSKIIGEFAADFIGKHDDRK